MSPTIKIGDDMKPPIGPHSQVQNASPDKYRERVQFEPAANDGGRDKMTFEKRV